MDMKRRILDEIGRTGPMVFSRFMELALYDPDRGYYSGGLARIGPGGDFITAPHVSAAFGRCLANFAIAADDALGNPARFHLIEGGPGEGELARVMLDALAASRPGLYGRLAWCADEVSPALAARQRAALGRHEGVVSALPPHGVVGLYLSNEVADALPVHLVEADGENLRELRVVGKKDGLGLASCKIEDGEVVALAESVLANPVLADERASGRPFRFEVAAGLGGWLARAASFLDRGYVVTIDYGDLEEKLYGADKAEGTLRGFSGGRFMENVLDTPGTADITASVNFSAYLREARKLGLASLGPLKQWELLEALGLTTVLTEMEGELAEENGIIALRQELWPLLFPGVGMGESFKAVVSAKNAPLGPLGEWTGRFPGHW